MRADSIVWKTNTGFLTRFLGFGIFLDRIFCFFLRIFGVIFGGFFGTFPVVFYTVLEIVGRFFRGFLGYFLDGFFKIGFFL